MPRDPKENAKQLANARGKKSTKGRPKGALNAKRDVAVAIDRVFGSKLDFWKTIAIQAKAGDPQAVRLLADRSEPPYKAVGERVELNLDMQDPERALDQIVEAIASGAVAVDTGVQFLHAVKAIVDARQQRELSDKIAKIEEVLGK